MKPILIATIFLLTGCSHAINLPDPSAYERGVVAGASACAVNQTPERANPGFKVWCEQNPKEKQCQK